MSKKRLRLTLLFCLLLVASSVFVRVAFADSATTDTFFALSFNAGESFQWQDLTEGNITFTIVTGTLTGNAAMTTSSAGGTLQFNASSTGTILAVVPNGTRISMNSVVFSGSPQSFSSGSSYTIQWWYGVVPTPAPTVVGALPQIDTSWLWLYLYEGDFLGFLQAYFINAFGVLDLVAALISMLFLVPLYLRTRSLLLLSIVWILLGSFFVVVMPAISGLAVIFMVLGIGGMIFKLFRRSSD